jgi:hypothetical protein
MRPIANKIIKFKFAIKQSITNEDFYEINALFFKLRKLCYKVSQVNEFIISNKNIYSNIMNYFHDILQLLVYISYKIIFIQKFKGWKKTLF